MKPVDLIEEHPEGGRFREVFRSNQVVTANGLDRAALTHIYFSLDQGEVSHFHRMQLILITSIELLPRLKITIRRKTYV